MTDFINFITTNKEWIFDGVGLLFITFIFTLLKQKFWNKPDTIPTTSNTNRVENVGTVVNNINVNSNGPSINPIVETQTSTYTSFHFELDKKLYAQLCSMLGDTDTLRFIHENNFAGFAYKRSKLEPLFEFEHLAIKPEFEFIDTEMNELLNELKRTIPEFTLLIAENTFYVDEEYSHVPPEWEYEQDERFWKAVNSLHDKANEIWQIWGSFVRLGRRKFGI